jgi:hypothetical protein
MISKTEKAANKAIHLIAQTYCGIINKVFTKDSPWYIYKFKEGMVIRFNREKFPSHYYKLAKNYVEPVDVIVKNIVNIETEIDLPKCRVQVYCLTTNQDMYFIAEIPYFRKDFGFYVRSDDQLGFFPRYVVKEIIE